MRPQFDGTLGQTSLRRGPDNFIVRAAISKAEPGHGGAHDLNLNTGRPDRESRIVEQLERQRIELDSVGRQRLEQTCLVDSANADSAA